MEADQVESIELKVRPGAEPAGAVDELSGRVPELKAQWAALLEQAAAERSELLELPPYELSTKPSKNFQVIGMLFKTIQAHQRQNEYPKSVALCCLTEDDATMYRQVYNFYIPNTKAERMNSGLWD